MAVIDTKILEPVDVIVDEGVSRDVDGVTYLGSDLRTRRDCSRNGLARQPTMISIKSNGMEKAAL